MVRQLQAKEPNLTPQQRQWLYNQQRILSLRAYDAKQQQHRKDRKHRKHRNHEKKFLFQSLHQLLLNVFDAVGYPKLLQGLYHRPDSGYENELFVRYEHFVQAIFEHAEKGVAAAKAEHEANSNAHATAQ